MSKWKCFIEIDYAIKWRRKPKLTRRPLALLRAPSPVRVRAMRQISFRLFISVICAGFRLDACASALLFRHRFYSYALPYAAHQYRRNAIASSPSFCYTLLNHWAPNVLYIREYFRQMMPTFLHSVFVLARRHEAYAAVPPWPIEQLVLPRHSEQYGVVIVLVYLLYTALISIKGMFRY